MLPTFSVDAGRVTHDGEKEKPTAPLIAMPVGPKKW
jgi:hypothetical protein